MKAVVYACGSMGAVAVRRLLDAGFYIPLAISEEEPGSSSVHELCGALNIPCMAPRDPNQFGWVERARKTRPDMLFCFNYPTLLKAQVLAVPKHGSFRLHRALLPEHRGPDPVRRAIMAGQRTTGVTLHELVVEPYGEGSWHGSRSTSHGTTLPHPSRRGWSRRPMQCSPRSCPA